MKTVMKRNVLFVIAAVLVLSLSVGFASAYFSDYEAANGSATVKLGGKTQIVEDWPDGDKSVQIKNIGETEVVVRVAIYGPAGMKITTPGNKWVKQGDYYYYNGVLKPNELTPEKSLIASVKEIKDDLGDNFDIVVMQESKQAPYDDNGNLLPMSEWFKAAESEEGGE